MRARELPTRRQACDPPVPLPMQLQRHAAASCTPTRMALSASLSHPAAGGAAGQRCRARPSPRALPSGPGGARSAGRLWLGCGAEQPGLGRLAGHLHPMLGPPPTMPKSIATDQRPAAGSLRTVRGTASPTVHTPHRSWAAYRGAQWCSACPRPPNATPIQHTIQQRLHNIGMPHRGARWCSRCRSAAAPPRPASSRTARPATGWRSAVRQTRPRSNGNDSNTRLGLRLHGQHAL